jgi:uncharacterized membrane protein YgcG
MVTGGLLTAIDWRWVFFAPVIVSAVILAGAVALIPRDTARTVHRGGFDLAGALTLTGSMLLLVATVVRAPDVSAAQTVATAAAGLVFLGAFVTVERRVDAPLIRLGLLRNAAASGVPVARAGRGGGGSGGGRRTDRRRIPHRARSTPGGRCARRCDGLHSGA